MSSGKSKLTSASGKRVDSSPRSANRNGGNSGNGAGNGIKKKKKKGKRPIFLWVVLIVALALFIFYKITVHPPDITPVTQGEKPVGETVIKETDPEDEKMDVEESSDPSLKRKDNFYTFLLIGTDNEGANTDVLMVASFDTAGHEVNVINIPRDTLVNVSRRVKKINAAYSVGGMDNLMEEVSTLIGFTPDSYMKVDLEGFVSLVDFIGGVEFDVPVNMNYDDPTQDLSIHFEKGLQQLEGQQALEVVRFRHNNDGTGYLRQDLDRIQTQQNLLSTVAKKMITPKTLFKINDLVTIAEENLDTDLSFGEMAWLGKEALGVDTDSGIHFNTLSEQSTMYQGLSYVYVEEGPALELINSTINPYMTDITELDVIQP